MGRKQYAHLPLTCHRGINQQRGKATLEECASALNVWAPDGIVEQRPGYVGVTSFPYTDCADQTATTVTNTYISETTGGSLVNAVEGGALNINSWAENAFWYIGFTLVSGTFQKAGPADLPGSRSLIGYNTTAFSNSNTTAMRYESSYYNGTEFVPLRVIERIGNPNTGQSPSIMVPHLADTRGSLFAFCPPGDWASSTINGVTAFFIRFKLKRADASTTALDSTVLINNNTAAVHIISPEYNVMRGLFAGQFPTTKRYIAVSNNRTTSPSRICWMMASDHEFTDVAFPDFESAAPGPPYLNYHDNALATHAVVPQFDEGFVAYGGIVKRYSIKDPWRHGTDGTNFFAADAEKETRDFAVGDEAPFDPDYVAAQRNFPRGTYIVYFKNRLWVAGMEDEPFTVRWGAAIPYHKVFPETANDILMEDDNSFITGMAAIGEHLAVFKRDSIWLMVAVGENPVTQVTDFRARKIVDGVGCVSHHSIQQIKGRLVFLAEDGVYAFDGTANIEKLSDRVGETIGSVNIQRSAFVVSAHWKTKNCYLLSVPTKGANDNDTTLVFDYKNDAWWVWNIPAALWLNDEAQADEESLYFVDNKNCLHQLGFGNTDHGQAITSSVVTQRIGEADNIRRTVRQVEVVTDNLTSSLTVAVRSNDDSNNDDSGTLSLTDDDEAKYASNLLFAVSTNYVLDRNRARRLSFRKQGDWLQVFVSHNTHNTPMKLRVIDVGLIDGTRR